MEVSYFALNGSYILGLLVYLDFLGGRREEICSLDGQTNATMNVSLCDVCMYCTQST